jgi:carboxypeptidase C (cathepsin A)
MTMNRLEFGEGGQPVYLDDLKLLQENMTALVLAMLPLTTGYSTSEDENVKNVESLQVYALARHINGSGDASCEVVQAHKLVTRTGLVYDVASTQIDEGGTAGGAVMNCYYVLKEATVEERTFEDGTTKAVVKSYTAEIVEDKPTSGNWIAVADVPSLDQMIALLPAKERYTNCLKNVVKTTSETEEG